jgi:glycosyltransferase involved in cell wall biosynthesis
VAVLIPALNEQEALPGVLETIPGDVGRVVVVDNGSTDRTAHVAREAGAQVVHEAERGYGAACLAGIRYLAALPDPPDVLVFLDADHSDDPALMPRLVEPIVAGRADLVLGVRASASDERSAVPLHARLGNRAILLLVRLLFGSGYSDLPPFRAVSLNRLLDLQMDDRTWGWTLQMQIRAAREGLRSLEVRVPYRRRTRGRSKISGSVMGSARAGTRMAVTVLRERMRRGRRAG